MTLDHEHPIPIIQDDSQPMEKTPINYELATYIWVLLLSSWGGIANYIRKIRGGHCRFSIGELIGDVVISGFVGIITFYLCESAKFESIVTAALVGISGHMGSRAIFFFEITVQKWLTKRLDNE